MVCSVKIFSPTNMLRILMIYSIFVDIYPHMKRTLFDAQNTVFLRGESIKEMCFSLLPVKVVALYRNIIPPVRKMQHRNSADSQPIQRDGFSLRHSQLPVFPAQMIRAGKVG